MTSQPVSTFGTVPPFLLLKVMDLFRIQRRLVVPFELQKVGIAIEGMIGIRHA
jgi:hypothetical protein